MSTFRTTRLLALSVAAAGIASAACSSSSSSPALTMEPETAAEIPAGAVSMTFEPIAELTTPISGIAERRRLVIRDEAAWKSFWDDFTATVSPKPDRPEVDFSTRMVIAATMGQQTSGGYTISVEQVAEKDGTLYAAVQETTPGVGCITTTVITAPAVAVTVPRSDDTVAFVNEELALPCAP